MTLTTDEIIEMAREAGFMPAHDNRVQRFAKLVAAKERERLASIAEKNGNDILAMQLRGEA
jgi:hypothetical protein